MLFKKKLASLNNLKTLGKSETVRKKVKYKN